MSVLLSVSVAILAGLLMTRIVKPLKLPDVTAYLIAGVLVGPYCLGALGIDGLGFTSLEAVEAMFLISETALGFIAFSIGNEFRLKELKHTRRQAVIVGIAQALTAALFVDAALLGMHLLMPDKLTAAQAITLGAIATATAPAATLMVVRQYKANGPLTDLLLPVVALDDAVGLVVFAISFGIAQTLSSGAADLISILVDPLVEIAASLLLGAVCGWVLTQLEKLFRSNTNRLNLTIAFVFLTVALSMADFSVGPVHVHDAGDYLLQPLSPLPRSDGKSGPLDLAAVCAVLCCQRRGAGAPGLHRRGHCGDRHCVYSLPLPGQILRRAGQHPGSPLPPRCLQVSGHHAAATGRRGPWYVHHRPSTGTRGRSDPEHHPVLSADL